MPVLLLLLAALAASSASGASVPDAREVDCPLTDFRFGAIRYDHSGTIRLVDGADVLLTIDTGLDTAGKLPMVSCEGNVVKVIADKGSGRLALDIARVDLTEILETLSPERRDPATRGATRARARLSAGDYGGALAMLDEIPETSAKLSRGALTHEILSDVLGRTTAGPEAQALEILDEALAVLGPTWPSLAAQDAAAVHGERGRLLCATGRFEEGLAELAQGPSDARSALLAGDAAWELGRTKEARAWYASYVSAGGASLARVDDRCRACRR